MLFLELAVTNQVWDRSYSRGEMGKRGKGRRVAISVFALHVCVCEWTSGCLNVCECAYEHKRMYEQLFLILNHPFVSVFMHVFKNSELLLEYRQERTLHGTLNGLL